MSPKPRFQRSVWVLDINDFILYLEDCFYRMSPNFQWLKDTTPIDRSWPWTETDRFTKDKTQRDYLIDWIICKYLRDVHYFDVGLPDYSDSFSEILHLLEEKYGFQENARYYLSIPYVYGDIHTHHIHRQSCWLYIEAGIQPDQQPRSRHALSRSFAPT